MFVNKWHQINKNYKHMIVYEKMLINGCKLIINNKLKLKNKWP